MQDVFIVLSTPYGPLKVAHKMILENSSSDFLCLLCVDEGNAYAVKTREEFEEHLNDKHKDIVTFLTVAKNVTKRNFTV